MEWEENIYTQINEKKFYDDDDDEYYLLLLLIIIHSSLSFSIYFSYININNGINIIWI